ncbi:glycosyltransferase family 2 protein [Vagococcus lutrae]|uniref:glycosyltransferase family 2 protein n=1 Tax=Vagococcus lutrae TaxID=81947 RepID=UPI002890D7E9|nr:glycosyltransferase family 2 protein [Vagococcus lutrae]MDT2817396.1 glycosyltransferase family 2 protein [Vagococcus lutrae]
MLVTIIMPVYNSEKYLEKSLSSVLNQTYQDFELIVINDGSSDGSLSIIQSFKKIDKRIKLYDLDRNRGISFARNIGIKNSKGKYIAFIDSDDKWKPNKLQTQIEFMKKNNIKFSYTNLNIIDNLGHHIGERISSKKEVTYSELVKKNYFGCSSVVIDAKVLKNYTFKNIKHEDYALWLEILRKEKIVGHNLEEKLCDYRVHDDSISSNKLKSMLWVWNIFRKSEKYSLFTSLILFNRYILFKIKDIRRYLP